MTWVILGLSCTLRVSWVLGLFCSCHCVAPRWPLQISETPPLRSHELEGGGSSRWNLVWSRQLKCWSCWEQHGAGPLCLQDGREAQAGRAAWKDCAGWGNAPLHLWSPMRGRAQGSVPLQCWAPWMGYCSQTAGRHPHTRLLLGPRQLREGTSALVLPSLPRGRRTTEIPSFILCGANLQDVCLSSSGDFISEA